MQVKVINVAHAILVDSRGFFVGKAIKRLDLFQKTDIFVISI